MRKFLRKFLGLDSVEELKQQVEEIKDLKGHTLLTDRELLAATLTSATKQLVETKQVNDKLRARLTKVEGELRSKNTNVAKLLEQLDDAPVEINSLELQGARSALAIALRHNEQLDKTVVDALAKLAQREAGIKNALETLITLDYFAPYTEDDINEWLSGRQRELNERIRLDYPCQ